MGFLARAVLLASLLSLSACATKQYKVFEDPTREKKEATVDIARAIQATNDGKKAKVQLVREFDKSKASLEKRKADLMASNSYYADTYDKEIQKAQLEIQEYQKNLTAPILQGIEKQVKLVGSRLGYSVVYETTNENPNKELPDLTDEVVAAYEKSKIPTVRARAK